LAVIQFRHKNWTLFTLRSSAARNEEEAFLLLVPARRDPIIDFLARSILSKAKQTRERTNYRMSFHLSTPAKLTQFSAVD